MKMIKNFLILLLVLCFIVSALAGCGGNKESQEPKESGSNAQTGTPTQSETSSTGTDSDDPAAKFEMKEFTLLAKGQTGTEVPTEDVLTPIWREKTKVKPEIISIPEDADYTQWFQMQAAANTLPQVITGNGIVDNPAVFNIIKSEDYIYSFTKEQLKKYMPRYVARLEQYGMNFDEVYQDNLDQDGKLWYIPGGFAVAAVPLLREIKPIAETRLGFEGYKLYLRDDILKKIYPNVKTEEELKQLFIEKNGKLTPEDVNDIPIKDKEDLYEYFVKVKELNMKTADGKEIIPGHPIMINDIGSAMWSMYTLGGFWWSDYFPDRPVKGDKMYFAFATDQWKEYMRWFNKCYNEGLIDKEIFIQDEATRTAKVINGQYAVFQEWLGAAEARKLSKEEGRGYGFRLLEINAPYESEYQDNQLYRSYSTKASFAPVIISKNVKEEDLPQVFNWIDWNRSEEADEYRYWGLPEWYTGEGMDRRWKPEFEDLKNWALYGKEGGKDGWYYGMCNNMFRAGNDFSKWNAEVYGLALNYLDYAYNPYYVYDSEIQVNLDMDIDAEVRKVFRLVHHKNCYYFRRTWSTDWIDNNPNFSEKFFKLKETNGWDNNQGKALTVEAIIGKPEVFDKNWEKVEGTYSQEFWDTFALMQAEWKRIYDEYEAPAREAARAAKE